MEDKHNIYLHLNRKRVLEIRVNKMLPQNLTL